MVKVFLNVVYYLFMLTFLIDKGDGYWKKTDREILQRDVKIYKKLAEKIERELQELFTVLHIEGHGRYRPNVNRHYHYTNRKTIPKRSVLSNRESGNDIKEPVLVSKLTTIHNETSFNDSITPIKFGNKNGGVKLEGTKSKWPKFEEILLQIGIKYDWKNDRWIKVKDKFKIIDENIDDDENSIMFHEKHRFSYRTIKLNRGKNKRNVVIAVTAIR